MRRKRRCDTLLTVRGVGMIKAVTVTGFARIVGKSRDSILRYERDNKIPPAPLTLNGTRYYPESFVKRIAPIIKKFPRHTLPKTELIVEINRIYNEEKKKLCPSQ